MRDGSVVAYPTDSSYALGCLIGDKEAMERIRRIRAADKNHNFTLVCRDLSEIARYARVDNTQYRTLRAFTPGPYTFLLEATREVPKRLQNPKRRTIGIRVPDNAIVRMLLAELGEPIMSSTLLLPGETAPMTDPHEIKERLEHAVDVVIDGGPCGFEPSSVVDLAGTGAGRGPAGQGRRQHLRMRAAHDVPAYNPRSARRVEAGRASICGHESVPSP